MIALIPTPPTPEAEQDTHTTSGRSADELWAETGRLRAKLADVNAQQDKSAPWLTQAHMLCTDHGIPQGHIEWRLEVLRGLLGKQAAEAEPVQQDTGPGSLYEAVWVLLATAEIDDGTSGTLADVRKFMTTPPAEKQAAITAESATEVKEPAQQDTTSRFIAAVEAELRRARAKFPGDRIMTIALAEEFGELAKAMLDESGENVWKEAVQTAVMAARVAIDGDSSVDEWRTAKGLDNHRCGGATPPAEKQAAPSGEDNHG